MTCRSDPTIRAPCKAIGRAVETSRRVGEIRPIAMKKYFKPYVPVVSTSDSVVTQTLLQNYDTFQECFMTSSDAPINAVNADKLFAVSFIGNQTGGRPGRRMSSSSSSSSSYPAGTVTRIKENDLSLIQLTSHAVGGSGGGGSGGGGGGGGPRSDGHYHLGTGPSGSSTIGSLHGMNDIGAPADVLNYVMGDCRADERRDEILSGSIFGSDDSSDVARPRNGYINHIVNTYLKQPGPVLLAPVSSDTVIRRAIQRRRFMHMV